MNQIELLRLCARLFGRLEEQGIRMVDDGQGDTHDLLALAEDIDRVVEQSTKESP